MNENRRDEMRGMWKKFIVFALSMLILNVPLTSMATELEISERHLRTQYTAEEQRIIENINPDFVSIPEVLELKEAGYLNELIKEMDHAYKIDYQKEMDDKLSLLEYWKLTPETTVLQLKDKAQEYLNEKYNGIQIDSIEFQNLVLEMFNGDSYPLDKMSKEDPSFGALYLYMCIYYNDNYDDNSGTFLDDPIKEKEGNKTLNQIIEEDVNNNFQQSTSKRVLQDVVEKYLGSRAPQNPLDGDLIQTYARKYAKSNNTANYVTQPSDCTNFASQALFYGKLPKTFYSSDKSANGYVEATDRWFYFNNSSTSKYSTSTSWVRVVDLYSYLSRSYAVHETSKGTEMTPYINKGFILQGKRLIGDYAHSVIAVKGTDGSIQYCGHSNFRKDEPIQTFYDAFSKYRVIQVY